MSPCPGFFSMAVETSAKLSASLCDINCTSSLRSSHVQSIVMTRTMIEDRHERLQTRTGLVQAIGLHERAEDINATLVQGSSSAILRISCWRKTCHAHALFSTELLDSGAIFVELVMDALPDSGSVPVVTIAAKACLCNRSVEASSVRALDRRRISRSRSICHRGVIGVSSICPETCEQHVGAIVSIQKAFSEDAIRTPSKMDSSALPGAQKGDSISLNW